MRTEIFNYIIMIPGLVLAITFHEFAHAKTAYILGDKSQKFNGRLTLNPLAHLDVFGMLCMLLFKFGWGKPVQINKRSFKNYYKDDLLVSLAGPVTNLLLAIVCAFVWGIIFKISPQSDSKIILFAIYILNFSVILNVNLFIFNLLPIPGFDGFHILSDLFPGTLSKYEETMYKYQFIIMGGIIIFGGRIVSYPANLLYSSILNLVSSVMF